MNGKIMKGIAAAFAGMLVMACSGCGGGGSGGSAAPVVAAASKPVMIDAEGDSTIYGYEVVNGAVVRTPNPPPVIEQADLQATLGAGITIQNNGVVGAKAIDSLSGGNAYYALPLSQRLAVNPAQIVMSNYAINDHTRTPDQYAQDITDWITTVRAAGKTPVLEEPNPICVSVAPQLDTLVDVLRIVAKQQNVVLIAQYDYIKTLDWQPMLADCVHPNDALYKIKADRAAAVLAPLVKSLQ